MKPIPPDDVYFLLVDDLEENLLALEGLLRRDRLVLLKARSGTEALELLLRHEVALALIDVQMPGIDGFELAELMRGSERTRRVPIIFLTAGTTDVQRRFRGYEAGAVDFLQKPIESDILRSKAEVFFELYRQRQEVAFQRDELKAATEENARLLDASRRYAQALQEADQRKDDFLAMLAHELRNPLAPVRNAVEILRLAGSSDATVNNAREIISRQVVHMARLVDDLLDVARIARGKIQLRTESCDLASVVRQTAEDYRPTLTTAGIALDVEIEPRPMPVVGDSVRLAQVVGNLLHNARKFTPAGGTVTVRARLTEDESGAVVTVQDTGAGMEPAFQERLFEPFIQLNQSLDRANGGLGLGLALVKGLIELHGGSVSVASEGLGLGSTFSLRVPIARPEKSNSVRRLEASPTEGRQRRILIIEDNKDSARTLQLLLQLKGHMVDVSYDGRAGLAAARSLRPEVIVSDLGLPGDLDGYAVARELRADPLLKNACLIALSGYGHDADRQRAQDAGFDQHLVKPVDLASLERLIGT